ncbi:MAG: ABC-2 type transport system ATP-binding protein [Planctomycetota bacterium]|jgi:ABC-2 type transport system ATP-binding protein
MPALSVVNARKSFGDTCALNDVSLDIESSALTVLLGPNGAGKTTLVRAIAGRVRLDHGQVTLFGEALEPGRPRTDFGLVPQELGVFPDLTARENLDAFGRFQRLAGAELKQQIDRALDWTGLADRANEPVRGFSGGMKRRINIACGVVHQPRLVILDEPTVGVDPQSRERIYEMLAELQENGTTILMTTHLLEEAERRCDHVAIIDHGRLVASGTLPELLSKNGERSTLVTFKLDRRHEEPVQGFTYDKSGRQASVSVDDVAKELPEWLAKLNQLSSSVEGIAIRNQGLQELFLELTGTELRE